MSALIPIRATFGVLEPDEITPTLVRGYVSDRSKQPKRRGARNGKVVAADGLVGKRMISVELAYLRAALKWAEHEKWIEDAPFIKLPAGAGVRARKRALSAQEAATLLIATRHPDTMPHIRTFVLLALATGQRGNAVRDLTWSQVDFERGTIFFSETGRADVTNKRRADVKMVASLAAHLMEVKKMSRSKGGFVIEYRGQRVRDVKTGFANLVARAGLADVNIHDLRRTAATLAIEGGRSFAEVATMLRQNVEVTQAHYAHMSPDFLTGVAAAIFGAIGEEWVDAPALPAPDGPAEESPQ